MGPLRLLIFGGSQGSSPINRLVCEALPFLPSGEITVVHQTGLGDYFSVKERYKQAGFEAEVIDFIQDMPAYFDRADLILSRAGASTVAEIAAAGRPSVLIPLPHAADDHQRRNAQALVEKEAALSLEQSETTGQELASLPRGVGKGTVHVSIKWHKPAGGLLITTVDAGSLSSWKSWF